MKRSHLLEQIYSKDVSPLEFKWDTLWVPTLNNYLYLEDVQRLNYIATSVKYASKIDMKLKAMNEILAPRGFKKFHSGTNRVVYQYLEDPRFLIKVAIDEVGMGDNPAEFKNQYLLKPFVTKVFDVTPCGTVGSFERIIPIMNRDEFYSVADDVYTLITKYIIGRYVLNDIGTNSWMNYGIRPGFGVCLLDFPYVYELDGESMYCNTQTNHGICGGEIDYDIGFNYLVCNKCGRKFDPRVLEKKNKDKGIILIGGYKNMRVKIFKTQNGKRTETVAVLGESNEVTKRIMPERKGRDLVTERNPKISVKFGNDTVMTKREPQPNKHEPEKQVNDGSPRVKITYGEEEVKREIPSATVNTGNKIKVNAAYDDSKPVKFKINIVEPEEPKKEEVLEDVDLSNFSIGSKVEEEVPDYSNYHYEEDDDNYDEQNREALFEDEYNHYKNERRNSSHYEKIKKQKKNYDKF